MKKFILFAARDGEAIIRTKFCCDLDAAERWSYETLRDHYKIEMEISDEYVDIGSETDGVILMEFEKLIHSSMGSVVY